MYLCPNCNSDMIYDISTSKLKCLYCNTLINIEDHPDRELEAVQDKFELTKYVCPQCAGTIKTVGTSIVEFCPYCGTSVMMSGRLDTEKKPNYIIPFSRTKEECKELFESRVSQAWCVPTQYKDVSKINQFTGIYLPHWVYSVELEGTPTFDYKEVESQGSDSVVNCGQVSCYFKKNYKNILYDAAANFNDNTAENILDYDSSDLIDFDTSVLCGFYADNADVASDVYRDQVQKESCRITFLLLRSEIRKRLKRDMNIIMPDPDVLEKQFHPKITGVKSALIPVWLLTWRDKNKIVHAVINGKTGKTHTQIPVNTLQFIVYTILMSLPLTGLFFGLLPSVLYFFEERSLEDWSFFMAPVHTNAPIILWTEIFTHIGMGVLFCKMKQLKNAIRNDIYDMGGNNNIFKNKLTAENRQSHSNLRFSSLGYTGSVIGLFGFFFLTLIALPFVMKMGLNVLVGHNLFDIDEKVANMVDGVCVLILLSYTIFMMGYIIKQNLKYIHSIKQLMDPFLLFTGIIIGLGEMLFKIVMKTNIYSGYYYFTILYIFVGILSIAFTNIWVYNHSCSSMISDYYERGK